MGAQPEHGGVLWLDNAAGTPVNYSTHVRNVKLISGKVNIGRYHTIDSRAEKTSEGGYSYTFTAEVIRDPAATSLHSVLTAWIPLGGLRTYQIDTPDSAAGSERDTGECRLESYDPGQVAAGSGEPAFGTATFVVHGGNTHSVIV